LSRPGPNLKPLVSNSATLNSMRRRNALEAIAVELFRQCGVSGQPVSVSGDYRALEQLRGHRPSCRLGSVREMVGKSHVLIGVSDAVGVGAFGGLSTRARMHFRAFTSRRRHLLHLLAGPLVAREWRPSGTETHDLEHFFGAPLPLICVPPRGSVGRTTSELDSRGKIGIASEGLCTVNSYGVVTSQSSS